MDMIPQDDTPRKRCTGPCGQEYPATSEFFNIHSPGRLRPICKICRSKARRASGRDVAYARAHKEQAHQSYLKRRGTDAYKEKAAQIDRRYKRNNRERIRQRNKARYYAHHESRLQCAMKYRQAHKEELLRKDREYRRANPEKRRAIARQYAKANRERRRVLQQNRIARQRAAEGKITVTDIEKQYANQKGYCYYCKVKLSQYHVDHVVPLIRGGSNRPDNLVITCPSCNIHKHDRLPHEFFEGGRLL